MWYVYAGEALLALLLIHIRLTMPWLFADVFTRYWPLVIIFVAFVGAGLSELFRRQGRLVLAEPLERTGAFLPLLPVLGYWLSGWAPSIASPVHYSAQLVLVGTLYGTLSIARRSFGFGLLAAVAANGGLWYFLQEQEGLGLLQHPQLWLIPLALSVLVAAYLNRDRLSEQQMTTIRYLCLMTVYVSSTADIFIAGVAHSPWPPMILAGLSVAGVLAGIALNVRSFLFLGSTFLLLALITVIWHASANLHWTWLWWVAGILLGLAILALFAVFEKQRDRVEQLLEDLKQWQA